MEQIATRLTHEEMAELAFAMSERLRHGRFLDAHEVGVDSHGRVSMPAVYRPAFDEGACRVAPVRDRNLELWTPHTFELVLEHRRRLGVPQLGGPRGLKMLQSRTANVAIDKQFRFVIPPALRQRIGLDPEGDRIVLAGVGEAIEIWPAAVWNGLDHSGDPEDLEYPGF